MVRALAEREHTDPSGRTVRFTRWTLDRWILDWRRGGFDALLLENLARRLPLFPFAPVGRQLLQAVQQQVFAPGRSFATATGQRVHRAQA